MPAPKTLTRPLVRNLHPYVPGEQPKIKGLIKLNTNENPFPPSPHVLSAIKKGDGWTATALSESDGATFTREIGKIPSLQA